MKRALGVVAVLPLLLSAPAAYAAGPPVLGDTWASAVFSSSARMNAEVDPNELFTTYHFDYITKAAYDANVAASKDGFTGASKRPPVSDAVIGANPVPPVFQQLASLTPETAYRYRVVAKNSAGTSTGPAREFITQAIGGGALLPDGRGWEMVSPVDKNGGQVERPGAIAEGGLLQAAAGGQSITYGSRASFGEGAQGAPPASQYVATRTSGGWSTQNVTAPLFAGSYDSEDEGVPYRLFSEDLARGLLLNGHRCRGEGTDCAVANPPLPGTGAPAGYQNYYLRTGGTFEALLGPSDLLDTTLLPDEFELSFAGASADLRHIVLSTCAALTANASEVPQGEGCDPGAPNLYRWSAGTLSLLNVLPAQSQGNPGAALAAPAAAVSDSGARVYWTDLATGNLYLREGSQTKQVDAAAGGGGTFQTATPDGSHAFFTKAGHLWRYRVATGTGTDLTPGGGVVGVLGAASTGAQVYFQDGSGLKLWDDGATSTIAPGAAAADAVNYPPASGAARASADGARLAFVSTEPLTGYDNESLGSGAPTSQVFLYDASADALRCLSCNPTNGRPLGPSSLPGAFPNGSDPADPAYTPRTLTADGRRLFFESSDALVLTDTNNRVDVYQWEEQGKGTCTKAGGCLALMSSGRSEEGATFVDSSLDGSDAFFLTDGSLVGADPGAIDLYDARVGGGFQEPVEPIACQGDACQFLPPEPTDPTLTTLLAGPGNPAVRYHKQRRRAKKRCRRKGQSAAQRRRCQKQGQRGRGKR